MYTFISPRVLFLMLMVFLFSGCTKLIDYLEHHPNAAPSCRITRIFLNPMHKQGSVDTLVFSYDRSGNPVSVLRSHTDTGLDSWFFYYDNKGRLVQALALYNSYTISNGKITGNGDYAHRYTYDRYNRIVTDTLYVGPKVVDGEVVNLRMASYYSNLEYDAKNRLSREKRTQFSRTGSENPLSTLTYTYDANGNLIRPEGPTVYDDKKNFNNTNKIWAFINRDYSVNNPFHAESYTAAYLPVKIGVSDIPFFLTQWLEDATIEYDCR